MNCDNTIAHVIMRGDTIYLLAKKYGTTVPEILMKNPGVNPYNLQIGSTLYICRNEENGGSNGVNGTELNSVLRRLWEQLSFWIRLYLLSQMNGAKDEEVVEEQLKRIPVEMGEVFADYYPPEVASQLQQELMQFVMQIAELISVVKDGEADEADLLEVRLEQNVKKLSEILSNLNINYDRAELERELGEYLMLTKREIVARLSEEYADDVDTFNEVERQGLKLADYLSVGIERQKNQQMR